MTRKQIEIQAIRRYKEELRNKIQVILLSILVFGILIVGVVYNLII